MMRTVIVYISTLFLNRWTLTRLMSKIFCEYTDGHCCLRYALGLPLLIFLQSARLTITIFMLSCSAGNYQRPQCGLMVSGHALVDRNFYLNLF